MNKSRPSASAHSNDSSDESNASDESPSNYKEELKFQLSQEIYDMLLRNISPQLDENENVVIEFDNQETKKETDENQVEKLKEVLNYTSIVIINPKKNSKKANLIIEEAKSSDSNINSQYFEQIRDISIAKIWIKSRTFNILYQKLLKIN